ncbi:peptidoglycan recognition protein 5 [Pholidichthys leucotaenia]
MAQKVVSRQEWRAVAPKKRQHMAGSAGRVVIHHTDTSSCKDSECKGQVLSIQRMHMEQRDFDDIGYNFLVGGDGTVFEGRGWGVVGAHAKGHNSNSVGIAFIGNFNNETPRKEAIMAVKQLLQSGVSTGHLKPDFALFGHRDLGQTECPGNNLYAALPQLKSTP